MVKGTEPWLAAISIFAFVSRGYAINSEDYDGSVMPVLA